MVRKIEINKIGVSAKDRVKEKLFIGERRINLSSRVRVWPFLALTLVAFFSLLLRLLQLTVVEGGYYRIRAEENRVVAKRVAAARGVFIDRNGEVLVRNSPKYKRQKLGTTIAEGEFEEISFEEASSLSNQIGQRLFVDINRDYLCGRACATVLGYVGEITSQELNSFTGDYILGDVVGKSGLEKVMEVELRGVPGSELLEVNAQLELVRQVGLKETQSGVDVALTIDKGLSQVLYEAFGGKAGGAVAQMPGSGEVLALVSSPAFDPNNVSESLKEEGEPFFNRVISGAYPPGSVFKVVTAVASLEEGKIEQETLIEDTGEIVIDKYRYGNWYYDEYGKVEGSIDIVRALQRSNDVFFYKAGEWLGAEKLAEWAGMFGFGQALGLHGFNEVAGVVPSPKWKERTKGEKWFLGNTYHMAIGQGDVLVTPLQINSMMAAVANGGSICRPSLVKGVGVDEGCKQLNLGEQTLKLVREGLKKACERGGTGVPFFDYDIGVACKTGSAQHGGEESLPHSWFSIYAPVDKPEIVLTVLVENSGEGSEVAAPVARKALDYWFGK